MWFRRLFSRGAPAKPQPTPQAGQGRKAGGAWRVGYLDPRSFVHAVQRLLAQRGVLHPRLHVFSLADFRFAAGAKWGRIAGLVGVVSDAVIRRHLNHRSDIFTHIDGETSLLALPLATRKEARALVSAIARDLAAQLFGDSVLGGRRPQVVAGNLAMEDAVTADGHLASAAVHEAVAVARAVLDPGFPAEPRLGAPHRAALARLVAENEADGLDLPDHAARGGGAGVEEWVEMHFRHGAQIAEVRPMTPSTTLALVWRPTWMAASRTIGGYVARVIRTDDDAPPAEGSSAYTGTGAMGTLTIDRYVATQAMRELRAGVGTGAGGRLIVPVWWSSLASTWRNCLLAPFKDSTATARRKRLMIEIVGLPDTVPSDCRRELIECCAGLGCPVLLRLPLGHAVPAGLEGIAAAGVDLGDLPDDERVGDEALVARLRALRRAVNRPCYVWGARRRPLVTRLARDGFAMVNGPALMTDLDRPYPVPVLMRAG